VRKLKIGNALAAEYITVGAYGKHVFVHVYTGDIRVQNYPARFPLSFYIEIKSAQNIPERLKLQLLQNDKQKGEFELEFPGGKEAIGVIVLPQIVVTIDEETVIKLVATGEGIEPTVMLQKKVSTAAISDQPT
jgi:hypothetical protein